MSDEYNDIRSLMGYDYYLIETRKDGRYIRPMEYIWDASDGDRVVIDDEGHEIPADVVVTEFTGSEISMKDILSSDDRFELMMDAEAEVQQYEGEYTFEQFRELFPPSELSSLIDAGTCYSAKHLPLDEITEDTPDGWYYS